jgi:hypothetical protein
MIPKSKLRILRVLRTRFASAAIAGVLGLVVSWSWKSLEHPGVVKVEIEEVMSVEIISDTFPEAPTTTIVSQMHACGPRANFHTYKLSDGTTYKRLERTRRLAAFIRSCVAEPLKRSVRCFLLF